MSFPTDPHVDLSVDALPDWRQRICREVRDLVHAADSEVVGYRLQFTARRW